MNGWVLLVIGLASLGLVCFAFVYLGYTGYRLVKAGLRLTRTYGPPAAELAGKAAAATERAGQAGIYAEDIMASLARLQVSLQRLQIIAEAFQGALSPYRRLRSYLGR
jgi:hypothetical protein